MTILHFLLDLSERSIRAELVEQDASSLYHSRTALTQDDVTMNEAIIRGLDLEEEQ